MDNPEKLAIQGTQYADKQNKTQHNMYGHHYMQTSTKNVDKTWALLQTTGGKDEPNIVVCGNGNGHHNTELRT